MFRRTRTQSLSLSRADTERGTVYFYVRDAYQDSVGAARSSSRPLVAGQFGDFLVVEKNLSFSFFFLFFLFSLRGRVQKKMGLPFLSIRYRQGFLTRFYPTFRAEKIFHQR